ncbi:hypothetical protein HO173_009396 [Letharia columbiana]|uniref:Heterokaryon incompatibility domain-containing protein n=1 Tax=Letharia columbiana TaxID=112416 RepID=A0A8H6FPK9_9LECA|nr:uncharacterized protein HO173_009396 [Letharia columbiana]KAF6232291.1 hypothetical protein HO173_009396 [Letharia columbiana]
MSFRLRVVRAEDSFVSALRVLLRDPWFTSLWTLQEMFLRADPSIVVKAAKSLEGKGGNGNNVGLANLIVNQPSTASVPSKKEHAAIFNLIEKLGPYHRLWEKSMLLFGAARHWQTRDPNDRVYGIMQTYGFKLGRSFQPAELHPGGSQAPACYSSEHSVHNAAQLLSHRVELGKYGG